MGRPNINTMEKQEIGKITHFFPKVMAAVVELKADLKKGDKILIEGHGNSFEQEATSMQIDRKPIEEGKAGQEVGLEVKEDVKPGDVVFKI